jgi:hypothetical protein
MRKLFVLLHRWTIYFMVNNLPSFVVKECTTKQMSPSLPQRAGGTPDAMKRCMNADLQARVRRIFSREFYRRGRLTWDMKMALRRVLTGAEPPETGASSIYKR